MALKKPSIEMDTLKTIGMKGIFLFLHCKYSASSGYLTSIQVPYYVKSTMVIMEDYDNIRWCLLVEELTYKKQPWRAIDRFDHISFSRMQSSCSHSSIIRWYYLLKN